MEEEEEEVEKDAAGQLAYTFVVLLGATAAQQNGLRGTRWHLSNRPQRHSTTWVEVGLILLCVPELIPCNGSMHPHVVQVQVVQVQVVLVLVQVVLVLVRIGPLYPVLTLDPVFQWCSTWVTPLAAASSLRHHRRLPGTIARVVHW